MSRILTEGFEGGNVGSITCNPLSANPGWYPRISEGPLSSPLETMTAGKYCLHTNEPYQNFSLNVTPYAETSQLFIRFEIQTAIISQDMNFLTISCPEGYILKLSTIHEGCYCGFVKVEFVGVSTNFSAPTFQAYKWNIIEAYVKISSDSSTEDGEIHVAVDGIDVCHYTDVITGRSESQDYVDNIQFYGIGNYLYGASYIDNIVIDTDDLVGQGDSGILSYYPSSDVSTEFTSSSGAANYSIVSSQPDIYYSPPFANVYTNAGPCEDRYLITATIGASSVDVLSVEPTYILRKSTNPVPQQLYAVFKDSSGVDPETHTQQVEVAWSYSYLFSNTILTTNPITETAWTLDDLDAVEFGMMATPPVVFADSYASSVHISALTYNKSLDASQILISAEGMNRYLETSQLFISAEGLNRWVKVFQIGFDLEVKD